MHAELSTNTLTGLAKTTPSTINTPETFSNSWRATVQALTSASAVDRATLACNLFVQHTQPLTLINEVALGGSAHETGIRWDVHTFPFLVGHTQKLKLGP